jgi:hypothetical protein
MGGDRKLEEAVRVGDHALAEERAADLEHQLVIVLQPELEHAVEGGQRPFPLTQLEQGLAHSRERVLVIGLE